MLGSSGWFYPFRTILSLFLSYFFFFSLDEMYIFIPFFVRTNLYFLCEKIFFVLCSKSYVVLNSNDVIRYWFMTTISLCQGYFTTIVLLCSFLHCCKIKLPEICSTVYARLDYVFFANGLDHLCGQSQMSPFIIDCIVLKRLTPNIIHLDSCLDFTFLANQAKICFYKNNSYGIKSF